MKIPTFRLFDFEVLNRKDKTDFEYYEGDRRKFIIKMFGMDEKGKTYCIFVKNFMPFFYVKAPDNWCCGSTNHIQFKQWLISEGHSIVSCEMKKMKDLYGFDNGKEYCFMKIVFRNMTAYNKVKKYWYTETKNYRKRTLLKKGFRFDQTGDYLKLYEAVLPPLLRYFHLMDISPSGWVTFKKKVVFTKKSKKETDCDYEYITTYNNIKPLPNKEEGVPMKVMSFDIEASSSHGDFPVARKTYKKTIGEVIQYWTQHKKQITKMDIGEQQKLFIDLMLTAFKYKSMEGISEVYLRNPKKKPSKGEIKDKLERMLKCSITDLIFTLPPSQKEQRWEYMKWEAMDDDEKEEYKMRKLVVPKYITKKNIVEFLNMKYDAGRKLEILDKALEYDSLKKICRKNIFLPKLEGDKCTFIGSTFLRVGEKEPYYNNMIALGRCDDTPEVPNSEIISCETERELLLKWTEMVKQEDPDIIIGYNIFGFDWSFMIDRAKELGCEYKFLEFSRNKGKDCRCTVVNSTTTVASGTYELVYPKIPGRLQIDLYNYFRKAENLASYKLDYVSSHFIGDIVKDYEIIGDKTKIKSKNLMGLKNGHFVCFELLGHSSDKYMDGKKFKISNLNIKEGYYEINFKLDIDKKKKVRWCLGKDDVTPQDIFRLTNEGPSSKAIVAKYCFQDCNLVHDLFIKNDIFTAMVEQANICSVPIEFIAMRGQGIKLLSFIAKECAGRNTAMPVIRKDESNDGYEGAICLPPKAGLYVDDPVAVVDYSSLYPSCMISENISQDSKVWTKEYDLSGKLIKVTGEIDDEGDFVYDNLEGFKYVNVRYDTYKYVRKTPKAAAQKVISGYKICRFAQYPNNEKAIMPAVLQELLASRKATRKLIKYKTITTASGEEYSGLLNKGDEMYTIISGKDKNEIPIDDVVDIKDTYNDFMKNVFDKRQLSKKIVANSLYGQCGGKTSSFYDKDIAASTTATGRKLLMYGKRVIEECYKNNIVDTTKYGQVRTKSEYIYGDTDSVFFTFNLEELDGTRIKGKKALEITIELAIQAGELASQFLKNPHDLEYEKTFMPFLLLSKKRYVGELYETNPNKCKTKSMGIVLKRRDNAACVKDCYGQVVDMLMTGQTADTAADSVRNYLKDMVNEKIGMDKLIITKSLNGFYKNPDSIAHKVLADRMGKRDPGNKPAVGSRIPFVYIQTKGVVKLQGDKVEHPVYIRQNKLKPDYSFYITNQIMKPVTQIFSLILEQLTAFNKKSNKSGYDKEKRIILKKYKQDKEKQKEKIQKLRDGYVKKLIFDDALRISNNNKKGQKTIKSFFG